MDLLARATCLLAPHMAEDRRGRFLIEAYSCDHRELYDSIEQRGATADFVPRCVELLLDRGQVGTRHALSLLLEVVSGQSGEEQQSDFRQLIDDLDAACAHPPDPSNPYRDLRAFQEEDAPYFFGRDAFTDELEAALDRGPFVAVIGPSGYGKSSVVQAGLIPRLRARGNWEVGILRPGAEPWRSLAGCLLSLLQGAPTAEGEWARLTAIGQLASQLAQGGNSDVSLHHVVSRIVESRPGITRLLLVVDQWEELYTHPQSNPNVAQRFAEVFLESISHTPLSVALTLRADFTGHALEHRSVRDRLQQGSVLLGPMTRDELEQAIEGPAQMAGVGFQSGLVSRILDELENEPGALPLLEFCLTRLYESRRQGPMRQSSYEAIGGVRGAIVRRADSVYEEIAARSPESGAAVRDLFLELVQLGEGAEDTRRRVYQDDLAGREAARALVTELASARLLVTGRDPGSEKDTVEVAHEALIRRWPRLRGWLDQDRDDLRLLREIERAAVLWEGHGQGESYRWSDERVMEAAPAVRRLAPRFPLDDREQRFLGPIGEVQMLERLQSPGTPQAERARIGDRLALLPGGDPRAGVGCRDDGLPHIVWHAVPGGEVVLEIEAKGFGVQPDFSTKPFHLARYPVTVAQWRAFLEAPDGYEPLIRQRHGWAPARQRGRNNQPAVDLTWLEAMGYCRWLSERLGYEVRLPTEWEWQQAATGADPGNLYPWGEAWVENRANTVESDLGRMLAVGLYPSGASVQGALDLAGNVWEWCLNEYDRPKETGAAGDAPRVLRGGSWGDGQDFARCAYRNDSLPHGRSIDVGFRLVCVSLIA